MIGSLQTGGIEEFAKQLFPFWIVWVTGQAKTGSSAPAHWQL
jgi:hypothetical protein